MKGDAEMRRKVYIQTDTITQNLVELLLREIKDLKDDISKLQLHNLELMLFDINDLKETLSNFHPLDEAQLYTEEEAAERLCISHRNLMTLRYENKIAYRLIGIRVRYSLEDILEFEEKCRIQIQR